MCFNDNKDSLNPLNASNIRQLQIMNVENTIKSFWSKTIKLFEP